MKYSRLLSGVGVACLGLYANAVVAFPQQTTYSNGTSATKTTSLSATRVTPAANLTTSCHLYYPGDIALNSWYTEHAQLTVATVVTNYIQYNNTKIALNSTTIQGISIRLPEPQPNMTAPLQPTTFGFGEPAIQYSMHFTIDGIPTDLIPSLATTSGNMYAQSVFHNLNETKITKTFTQRGGKVEVYASPTPFIEPDMVEVFLDVYDGTEKVSSTVFAPYTKNGELGGVWPTSVDWPCQVTFDTVPTQFLDWMMEFPNMSSSYPILSRCTEWTSLPITGAPTVHIVVSTLTHQTDSVVSTVNGNYGSVTRATSSKPSITQGSTKPLTTKITSNTVVVVKSSDSVSPDSTASPKVPIEHLTVAESNTPMPIPLPTSDSSMAASAIVHLTGTTTTDKVAPTLETIATFQAAPTSDQAISQGGSEVHQTDGENPGGSDVSSQQNGNVHQGTTTIENVVPTLETLATYQAAPTGDQAQSQGSSNAQQTNVGSHGEIATSSQQVGAIHQVTTQTSASGGGQPLMHATGQDSGFSIGSSVVMPNSDSAFVYGSQTLSAGGPVVTADGHIYSIATSASEVYLMRGDATSAQSADQTAVPAISVVSISAATPAITLGSSVLTADSASNYIIGSQTLAPGNSAITVKGTTYSLATSASAFIINGVTTILPTPDTTVQTEAYVIVGHTLPQSSALEISGTIYSLLPSLTALLINGETSPLPKPTEENAYAIGSETLTAGAAAITVSGTTYSIPSDFSTAPVMVVNGVTTSIRSVQTITAGEDTYTAIPAIDPAMVIGSQTLSQGDKITVTDGKDQHTLSLASNGAVQTVGNKGLGAAIMSGIGGGNQTSSAATTSTGARSLASTKESSTSVQEQTTGAKAVATGTSSLSAGAAKRTGEAVFAMAALFGAVILL